MNETGLLSLIEQHRKVVFFTPFILAAALGIMYTFGGADFRQVLDFMSPGNLLGH